MKKMTKWLSLLLAVGMLLSLFAACGSNTTSSAEEPNSGAEDATAEVQEEAPTPVLEEAAETSETEASAAEAAEVPALTAEQQNLIDLIPEGEYLTFQEYPLSQDPDATLSVFYSMHPLLSQYFESPAELPITEKTEEITGVHIEYTVASFMNADTQVQLMMA